MKDHRLYRLFFSFPALAATLALGVGACGDDTSNTNPNTNTDKYALEKVCDTLPTLICQAREPCCAQATGYDEAACMASELAQCEGNVADVKAGTMTYDSKSIDACVAALEPYAQKCFLNVTDYFTVPADLEPCAKVFQGKVAEDGACERDAQCASSVEKREISQCNDTSKKCSVRRIVGLNAACDVSTDPAAVKNICDTGLYCDFDLFTMKGNCQTAKVLGEGCNPGPIELSCGLGNYCDGTTKVCAVAKDVGEACSGALDCKSLKCDASACAKPDPIFDAGQCGKM